MLIKSAVVEDVSLGDMNVLWTRTLINTTRAQTSHESCLRETVLNILLIARFTKTLLGNHGWLNTSCIELRDADERRVVV